MWFALLIVLLATLVAVLLWRSNQARSRLERQREERRARTDQMLARVLLGEERAERHTIGGGPVTEVLQPPAPPSGSTTRAGAVTQQPVDVDILLEGEPTSVAERARQQLGRPTTLSGVGAESTAARAEGQSGAAPLSLLEGRIEVPLDALVVAWFSARGYRMKPAPESAQPIRLLMTHCDDSDRSYAFFFDRGRLHAQRAAELLQKARSHGVKRLLVAAEHGADASVDSARLRDVLVLDWISLDREIRKLDFGIAAKLIAIARTRRGVLGLA
ncbi:MAG: hypothetical protein IPM30_05360 [Burkholderiales bacterium]|nr:hypothetical protein [Burkholderiales bacterium]